MNKKSISIFCSILMIVGTALPWTSMQATSSSPGIGIWIFIGSAILFTLLTIKISKQDIEKKEN